MFYAFDIAGSNKPARPPALQVRSWRVRADRIIIAGAIGGPAASPAAGTNATRNPVGGAPARLAGGEPRRTLVPTGTNVSCV